MKLYKAMVWMPEPDTPGRHVSVRAESLEEAMEKLEAEHGRGNVFDLHNEADAAKPRDQAR